MTKVPTIDAFLANALRSLLQEAAGSGREVQDSGLEAEWPEGFPTEGALLEAVWKRIDYHGIAVLLHSEAARLGSWPERLRERIAEEARIAALWEATHARAVADVLDQFAGAGVESVVMKGTALAYWLHRNPAIRRRGDSDLLVRPGGLKAARDVLTEAGWYRNDDPLGLNLQEGWITRRAAFFGHMIDLHWAPSDNHSLRRLLALEDCFAHCQPLPRLHESARRPDAAFMIVHAAVNQAWHAVRGYRLGGEDVRGRGRLIWSLDFVRLLDEMKDADHERLVSHCAANRAGPLIADALRAACRDLGRTPPAALLARLEDHELDPVLTSLFHDHDTLSEFWFDFKAAPDWRERGRMVSQRALPPRAHLEAKYPRATRWPTQALRVRLLLGAVARAGGRAGRHASQWLRTRLART